MSDTENYTVTVEDAGPARKRLSVTIASALVDTQLQQQIKAIGGTVDLPGFRKGKVPRAVIEKRFGEAIRDETRNAIVKDALEHAIEANELDMLQQPEPQEEDFPAVEAGQDFAFTVEMDIVPSFELPDFTKVKINKPTLEVTDEMVNDEIGRQCLRNGHGEELKDDFQPGDRLLGHANVMAEGEETPIFDSENIIIVLPPAGERGQVLGLLIDDLNATFKGISVGGGITLNTVGPDNHEREDVRGKNLVITFQVQVAERITPLATDELIEAFNLGTAEVLNDQVKLALEQRRDDEQATAMRDQARKQLAEIVDVEIPEKLSSHQVAYQLENLRMQFMQQGLDTEEIETKIAEAREDTQRMATVGIKNMFIQRKVIKQYGITVNEQEVNAQVAKLASQRGMRPMELHAQLAQSDQLRQLNAQIMENKAVDSMVQQMNITEINAEEWMAMQSDEAKTPAKKKTAKKTSKKASGSKKTAKKTSKKSGKKTSGKSDS